MPRKSGSEAVNTDWRILMIDVLHREAVYLWYYFSVQLGQIFWYRVLGMVIGSALRLLSCEL